MRRCCKVCGQVLAVLQPPPLLKLIISNRSKPDKMPLKPFFQLQLSQPLHTPQLASALHQINAKGQTFALVAASFSQRHKEDDAFVVSKACLMHRTHSAGQRHHQGLVTWAQ